MAGEKSYDPLLLERLLAQLDSIAISIERLGPGGVQVKPQEWLRDVLRGVLAEVESAMPDKDFFRGLVVKGQTRLPSQLVETIANIWEASLLLNLARSAITLVTRDQKRSIGFGAELS
jgi:hypothetical protein